MKYKSYIAHIVQNEHGDMTYPRIQLFATILPYQNGHLISFYSPISGGKLRNTPFIDNCAIGQWDFRSLLHVAKGKIPNGQIRAACFVHMSSHQCMLFTPNSFPLFSKYFV